MIRIGHAWDVHKLVPDRKLYLGGVLVEFDLGLLGHSDADVVLHAIAESLLGSLALGDLGKFYPDSCDDIKNIDSKIILEECYQRVKDYGYHLVNIDLTIYAENIKIAPIRDNIQKSISAILKIDTAFISVKATTYEKMGFIGRGEAIACECVCLVEK